VLLSVSSSPQSPTVALSQLGILTTASARFDLKPGNALLPFVS